MIIIVLFYICILIESVVCEPAWLIRPSVNNDLYCWRDKNNLFQEMLRTIMCFKNDYFCAFENHILHNQNQLSAQKLIVN